MTFCKGNSKTGKYEDDIVLGVPLLGVHRVYGVCNAPRRLSQSLDPRATLGQQIVTQGRRWKVRCVAAWSSAPFWCWGLFACELLNSIASWSLGCFAADREHLVRPVVLFRVLLPSAA